MQYKLPHTTTIGRSKNCDIQVHPKNTKVSREHAEIKIHKNNMYVLYDKSALGTFVNGKKEKQIVLKNGDNINLGGVLKLNFANGVLSSSSPGIQLKQSAPAPIPVAPIVPPMSPSAPNPPPYQRSAPSQQRQYVQHQTQHVSTGYKISTSGAIVAIIFFFMPWVFTSCGTIGVEQSGLDLALGSTVDMGWLAGGVQKIPGEPIMFLVLIAAFIILFLSFLAYKRGQFNLLLDGLGPISLGALPLLVLFGAFVGMQSEAAQYNVYVEYKFGLWAVVLGYIAVIIGGILNIVESRTPRRFGSGKL